MSKVFTPVVDADAVYGEGDWRPLLGDAPRKADWKLYMIGKQSIEHRLKGIILPAYDWSLSIDDKAFGESVGSCWSSVPDKRLGRHFTPNAFAIPLLVYPYMGERKEHWISPGNRRNMIGGSDMDPEDGSDAFDDLNKWIRRNKAFSDQKKDFFLKAPSMKEDALVPGRTIRYFCLARCYDKETPWHDAVVAYTPSAYSYIIEQMRWAHQAQDGPPRDPNWPQYMLGDPTSPEGAIEWHVDKVQLDAKDQHDTNVLVFTERAEFLDANQKTVKLSRDDLARRFRLPDPDNWNIPTYEEQVDYMMNNFDAAITAEMIRAACSYRYRGEIPASRPDHIMSTAGAPKDKSPDETEDYSRNSRSRTSREPEGDPIAAVTGGGGGGRGARLTPDSEPPLPTRTAPPRESAAPARTPAAAVAATGAVFWAGATGEKPTKMTVPQLQEVVDKGQHEGFKVMVAQNDWKLLAESGLVVIPEPPVEDEAPPSVPDDDAPPSVPEDDAPPSVPADAPKATARSVDAPTAEGQCTLEQMKERLFPDTNSYNSLSSEQKKKAEELVDRAWKGTNFGAETELPDDVVDDLLQLV
jgi:hypothetical protein